MNGKTDQSTQIKIIGNLPRVSLVEDNKFKLVSFQQCKRQTLDNIFKRKNYNTKINPVKIYAHDNFIACIDQKSNAWLITQAFRTPINISLMFRKPIVELYLGEKQMIIHIKKDVYLLNWGSKKLLDSAKLSRVEIFQPEGYEHYFQAFLITNASSEDKFYYSFIKKAENSDVLFHIEKSSNQILGYPTLSRTEFKKPIKGISLGKFHNLCWDQSGKLYSWGSKSLALGHKDLPQQSVENPEPVNLNKIIMTAYASTSHYSLALTSDGVLYEWGIKKQPNLINEEHIFKPRTYKYQHFKCDRKFVSLKGFQNNFAALSFSSEIFVWGDDSKKFINPLLKLPKQWTGNCLYQPILQTDFYDTKIIDFQIKQNFLSVITAQKDSLIPMREESQYWSNIKEKAQKQIERIKMFKLNTMPSEMINLKKSIKIHIWFQLIARRFAVKAKKEVIKMQKNIQIQTLTSLYHQSVSTIK